MDLNKHTVVKLRDLLKERGLDTKGVKSILVERLAKALENESKNQPEEQEESESSPPLPVEEETPRKLPPRTPGRSTRNAAALAAAVASPKTPSRSSRSSASRQFSPPKFQEKPEEIPEEEPQPKKSRIEETVSATEKKKPEPAQKESEAVSISPKKMENEATAPAVVEKTIEKSAPKVVSSPVKVPGVDSSLQSSVPKIVEQAPEVQKTVQLSPQKPVQQPSPQKPVQQPSPQKLVQLSPQKPDEQPSPQKPAQQSPQKPAEQPSPQKPSGQVSPQKPAQQSPQKPAEQLSPQKPVQQSPQKLEQSPQKVEQSPQKTVQHSSPPKIVKQASPEKLVQQSPQKPAEKQSPQKPVQQSPQKPNEQLSPQKPAEKQSPQKPQVSPKKSPVKEEKGDEIVTKIEIDDSSKISGQGQILDNAQRKEAQEELEDVDMKEENESQRAEDDNEVIEFEKKSTVSPQPAPPAFVPKLPDDEPEFDENSVILSWYDSDLNLKIEKDTFTTAAPMQDEGFKLLWAGARASYGVVKGKVFYEAKIIEPCQADAQLDSNVHALRLGWSVLGTTMQLGEETLSFGFESTGKKCSDRNFEDYGQEFGPGDVVGSYLDLSDEKQGTIKFSVNEKDLGVAFTFDKESLDGKALFPHILSKNYRFACNFGESKSWAEPSLQGYGLIGSLDMESRVKGPKRPEKKEDCEVIMMCGLPASGKSYWTEKHVLENPEKMFYILDTVMLLEKTKIMGQPTKQESKEFVDKICNKVLNKLIEIAYTKRRNYILDQTNTYPSAQKRKMKNFVGFQKKAVVVVPNEEEYKARLQKHRDENKKQVPDQIFLEMKANFKPPSVGQFFDLVEWIELDEQEGKKMLEQYNKEGKAADLARSKNQNNRDNRNNWDVNRWSGGYVDRNRGGGSPRRGGNNGGNWRDNRGGRGGGPMRHGNFGGVQGPWRGRGGVPPHRGVDRRPMGAATGDRRSGNDRNRSMHSGQSWGQPGYQGQQGGSWAGQAGGAWPAQGQAQGWGAQQGSWAQQPGAWNQSNWKGGYGQQGGNYAPPTNYTAQPHYDNGNYNNWNQQQQQHQYYNQAYNWGQSSGSTNTSETENKQ